MFVFIYIFWFIKKKKKKHFILYNLFSLKLFNFRYFFNHENKISCFWCEWLHFGNHYWTFARCHSYSQESRLSTHISTAFDILWWIEIVQFYWLWKLHVSYLQLLSILYLFMSDDDRYFYYSLKFDAPIYFNTK